MNPIIGAGRRRWMAWLSGLAIAGAAAMASAHHGWDWAEQAQSTLEGTVESVSMAPPHPRLQVKADDGSAWQIDLGNPSQTERSGFRADSARPGDRIVVLGNRNKDAGKQHMKAVRITLDGRHYDLYPERLKTP
ncbi:DUF6152 family protein [Flavobacterium sp. MXW15]|uniref:DUF6152 family protein n=1 Tax=Xanthomonas chitinilytica TaxID=2989819 RepID=A0ABT3JWZ3_9XANT|nr:DUF6152 family protein [Xanthomonas sp. H13-6]MCW4455809.1 DUF6152 family protein [Flavobacterium sp. MXW15]MCW4473024.1 DUF6152 family protein [Xanthomonas sp. H13-6]